MLEKEQKFYQWVCVLTFLGLMFIDMYIEGLLVLIIGHLVDVKYELRKLNDRKRSE